MNRSDQTDAGAAAWILAQEEDCWSDAAQADFEAWFAASDANKAAYWRLKHSWRTADRILALGATGAPGGEHAFDAAPSGYSGVRWRVPASIAAAVVAIAGIGYNLSEGLGGRETAVATRQFDTAVGARQIIELADGSKVELNTASRARAALTEKSREFWLEEGEAYFEVKHRDGLPFVVHSGNRQVTVLGTKFSVRRIGSEVAVSVLEGRVRVEEVEGKRRLRSTVIAGGDIARTDGPATLLISRSEAKVQNSLAWRDGMLNFDQTRLAEAAAEFNRYNRKPIVITDADVADIRIGGTLPAGSPDAFVRLLHDAYGLKVVHSPQAIEISN